MVSFYTTLMADLCVLELKAKITSRGLCLQLLDLYQATFKQAENSFSEVFESSLWENIPYCMCRLYVLLSENVICCRES